ncbi:MAG TPA: NAD-dependent epimerase/dehydratase family protein [Gaiellaceae bacterium]
MPTAVVTGGAGFLGSHLCEYLLGRGVRVICVDNLVTSTLGNIEHIRDDDFVFLNHDMIEHLELDEPVDVVYHFAALASPVDYLRMPLHSLKVGSYGTHHALGLAKFKRARFLLASTSEVYGDPQVHPQPETYWGHVNPIGPRGVYDEAKRYAEALTMAYHNQQGVDTAIVRIFNSILADEQVLYDDGRELRREPVSRLAARLSLRTPVLAAMTLPSADAALGAAELPLEDVRVPAFGGGGRLTSAVASSLVAHPPAGPCFEVVTRYGRSIRVTGDHSVFVEGEDGRPEAREVSRLSPGDRIAIAARIDVPERDRSAISMLDVWAHAEGDPWELTVEAEGLGVLAWAHRRDLFGLLVTERRNAGPNRRNGAWTKLIRMRETDRLPLPVLRRVVERVPQGARVRLRRGGRTAPLPAAIELTDELLWLLGLWVAEGCRHASGGNAFITISCDEEVLARAASIVERQLGLHVVHARGSADRAASIFVHSKLLLHLLDFLGFEEGAKRIPGWILGLPLARLKWFVEGYREGDGVHSGRHCEEGKRHEFSTVDAELKDDLVVVFARFGLVPSVGRYATRFRQKTGERTYPFWRLTLPSVSPWSPLLWDRGVGQRLQSRRTGDIVWAPIREIREIEPTALVYDFSVPGFENFWAGTGVMASNTYGPRMRAHDGRAIPTFVRQALANEPLTVYGDGSQTRSFCYVDDLVRGIVLLAESSEHFPVNIGNPSEFTILELAQAVLRVTGSGSEIVYEALPVDDPQIRQPDITRARQVLGWEPEVQLEDGLRRMLGRAPVGV